MFSVSAVFQPFGILCKSRMMIILCLDYKFQSQGSWTRVHVYFVSLNDPKICTQVVIVNGQSFVSQSDWDLLVGGECYTEWLRFSY